MPLHAIVYSSRAHDDLAPTDLDALLHDATAFNRVAGVTGVLMFDGHCFLQCIEGPRDGVDSVFARIRNARSHQSVQVLARAALPQRLFPRWSMASRHIDTATTAHLCQADWHTEEGDGQGWALLQAAWTGSHGELEPAAVCLGS